MRRAFLRLAAAFWLAFICYATLSPLASRPGLLGDTALVVFLEHVCAYALLGVLLRFAICSRPVLIIALVASIACALECLQAFTADRHARLLDAAEKVAGGWLGVVAAPMVAAIASHLSKMRPEAWTRRGEGKGREPQPHSH
ncbi:VanZ family protein [Bradyrhizobium sp. ORS 111]|uniref:VanZ family protein n=1 Tax=Bradyrhizobium sp. ORS 111 TaxID=1685958 RepID=UPI0038900E6D